MSETVDIILPTYCRPHTISFSIQAVLRQSHPHFEVHVVGDGCDDATENEVRRFSDSRVHFYRFPKGRGHGYANRNRVLRQTSGEFIAYASDDDLWFSDHLERGLAELRQRQLDLVAFRSTPVVVPDDLEPFFFAQDWGRHLRVNFLRNWFTGALTLVHKRQLFESIGYWNDELFRFGDREFFNRARLSVCPTAYVDVTTVLRFYAMHWDRQYASLAEPPQKRYVDLVANEEWLGAVRAATADNKRPWRVRRRQWADFSAFALRSGPKFLRFLYERARSNTKPGAGLSDA
jgi:glycosyltransferase involved in cell wall biosynthesis